MINGWNLCQPLCVICACIFVEFFFLFFSGQKFSAVPRTQSVVVGSNMTMYCITSNHTSSSSVKWYKNDVILSDHFTSQGVTNEVLFIQNITLEDAGGYSCVAPSGENMTALLTVLGMY